MSVTERGIDLLRTNGALGRSVPSNEAAADGIRYVEHLLAINWSRIHLARFERTFPRLSVMFLSSTFSFLERGPDGELLVSGRAPVAADPLHLSSSHRQALTS